MPYWSPAHEAVELEDLPRLRDLLDAGHDAEDDNGDGFTLLRHAIDVEHDGHVQTGQPLHADVTAFLLARGADPLHQSNGISVVEEAATRGHWLAADIMRGWINQGSAAHPSLTRQPHPQQPATQHASPEHTSVAETGLWTIFDGAGNLHWQRTKCHEHQHPELAGCGYDRPTSAVASHGQNQPSVTEPAGL
jgi:hypothetical protein